MLRTIGAAVLAASLAAGAAAAQQPKVGSGQEYKEAPPFPSQRDQTLLMRRITVIDPKTGAKAQINVLSNSPVPNPGNVPSAEAAGRDAAARASDTYRVETMTVVDPVTGRGQTVRVLTEQAPATR